MCEPTVSTRATRHCVNVWHLKQQKETTSSCQNDSANGSNLSTLAARRKIRSYLKPYPYFGIDIDMMICWLQDGIKQTEVDTFVAQQFRQADTDGDGQVTFEDFCEYYQAMSLSKARLELRSTMGMEAERRSYGLVYLHLCIIFLQLLMIHFSSRAW